MRSNVRWRQGTEIFGTVRLSGVAANWKVRVEDRLELRDDFTAEIEAGMKDIAKVVAQVSNPCHYPHLLESFLSESNANRRRLGILQPSGIA